MRKIVAGLAITLDGVVESPSQSGWMLFNDEMAAMISEGTAQSDTILLGRRTYLEFAALWPHQGSDVPMAGFMNNTPKHVVSSILSHQDTLKWANSHLITGDLAEAVATLKRQPGKYILIPGSPTLVRSLLRDGLLDELNLMIHPIVVGSGMRLFEEMTAQVRLKLVESRTLSTGVLSVTYHPASA
ncbi:MAG: dihydrofolate reductase family protein [Ktedonobacterales bacterium]